MRQVLIVMAVLAALMAAGCGRPDPATAGLQQQAQDHEKRVAYLEEANRALQTRLKELEWQYAAIGPKLDAVAQPSRVTEEEVERAVREALEREAADREARQEDARARWGAQAEERADRQPEEHIDRLAEALTLTDEQKQQVANLSTEVRQAMREAFADMREQGNFNRDNIPQVMEDMTAKTEEGMKKILSDEQFQQYQNLPERDRRLGWGMWDGRRRR